MIKLSDNIIVFPARRVQGERCARVATAAPRASARPICHWDTDPATGRPIRVWTAAASAEDAEAITYLRLAG